MGYVNRELSGVFKARWGLCGQVVDPTLGGELHVLCVGAVP